MANIKLGCSTMCVAEYHRGEALEAIAAAGFKYAEGYSMETESRLHPDVVFAETVLDDLRKNDITLTGLNVTDITVGVDLTGIKLQMAYAQSLKLHGVHLKGGHRTPRDLNALVNCLKVLVPFGQSHDIAINIRNHHGNRIETIEDIENVLQSADASVGLALDVGQLHISKIDPAEAIDKFYDRIRAVYLRDYSGTRPVSFGKGDIDFASLLGKLIDRGFDGTVVAEPEIKGKKVEKPLTEAHEYLESLLKQHAM